ncbi:helix-turn-helix transcriptional regulator [Tsukamurella sp. 1534]|uniref:ArsR/SmtB family transcription factor n=1 Tax=Tsukamurella sp. 1534 TaxID=1151061 RepID=UPI000316B912|nr:metalloregulator ArsR/SmtB family transcription factor [Tsukamurella sp. 1534]
MTQPAQQIDATLAALSDPVRRRVVELLSDRPRRPGELAEETGTSAPTLSKHLRVLRTSGLVTEEHPEHDARVRIYTLRSAPMKELRAWLDAAEQGWAQQLSAFARFIEEDQ